MPGAGSSHRGRTLGLSLCFVLGFSTVFVGLGAGWANVPALNLLMGVPMKLAAGTSGLVITMVNAPAAWIYFHQGAMLPIIVAPSLLGVMLGARVVAIAHGAALTLGRHFDEDRAFKRNAIAIGGAVPCGGAMTFICEIGLFALIKFVHRVG